VAIKVKVNFNEKVIRMSKHFLDFLTFNVFIKHNVVSVLVRIKLIL
jgi:hypothetical protein